MRFPRATTGGGGTVAKSDDGVRCVVAGRECASDSLLVFSPDDPVDQPCAFFACQIHKRPQLQSKSRPSASVDIASSSPRTSGMAVDSRLKVQALTSPGVAAVGLSLPPSLADSDSPKITTTRY